MSLHNIDCMTHGGFIVSHKKWSCCDATDTCYAVLCRAARFSYTQTPILIKNTLPPNSPLLLGQGQGISSLGVLQQHLRVLLFCMHVSHQHTRHEKVSSAQAVDLTAAFAGAVTAFEENSRVQHLHPVAGPLQTNKRAFEPHPGPTHTYTHTPIPWVLLGLQLQQPPAL